LMVLDRVVALTLISSQFGVCTVLTPFCAICVCTVLILFGAICADLTPSGAPLRHVVLFCTIILEVDGAV
jgi:hypothetical protein